ncbi:MAG: AAA family ATPase, partial [Nitriliruptorales bacterium]|nr:AAA family ATPase [Nitriliruptorales bacterium]
GEAPAAAGAGGGDLEGEAPAAAGADLADADEDNQRSPLAGGTETDVRLEEQESGLVRKLGLLGTVNPLAQREYQALQERHEFLSDQLEDLRSSRRDLTKVVEAVDERIRDVFGAAFTDVAAAFTETFPRLFPGGDGRLVLTDPADLLNTGVEVEARPPGKRVKRLSLLSGGERSLTALAVLFAIFKARPSPFYVLDEVEASLDDVNLRRFLDLLTDLGRTSQLLVVSHQKRTMEIAGTLYGITMRGDGVSRVLSERMADRDPDDRSSSNGSKPSRIPVTTSAGRSRRD